MSDRLREDWDVDEPSPDFAGRVVAAAMREPRTRSIPRYATAVGVAVAIAAVALLFVWPRSRRVPAQGDVTAVERIEVPIGDRGVAVLEPGARLRWQGDHVEQERGEVFYRVERGATFTVHTPSAEAQVLGTCFRISIEQESEMKRRDVATGAVGAAMAAVVVVGVYEGKVRVSHAEQSVTVRAGESAVADGTGVRAANTVAVAKTADPNAGSPRTEEELCARLAEVGREKALLESELTAANDAVGKRAYDLTPEDWAKLAERGEFKYQYPCFQKGGFRPSEAQLQNLGLPPQAAETIQQAYVNSNTRFAADMKPICKELMGIDADLSSCIPKLFQAIYSGPNGAKATFKQVAEIRAGKRPEADATTPEMKMLLVFSGGMAPFEAELAKVLGADEAHRIAYSDDLCFQAQSL
jgi:FecR protein